MVFLHGEFTSFHDTAEYCQISPIEYHNGNCRHEGRPFPRLQAEEYTQQSLSRAQGKQHLKKLQRHQKREPTYQHHQQGP